MKMLALTNLFKLKLPLILRWHTLSLRFKMINKNVTWRSQSCSTSKKSFLYLNKPKAMMKRSLIVFIIWRNQDYQCHKRIWLMRSSQTETVREKASTSLKAWAVLLKGPWQLCSGRDMLKKGKSNWLSLILKGRLRRRRRQVYLED